MIRKVSLNQSVIAYDCARVCSLQALAENQPQAGILRFIFTDKTSLKADREDWGKGGGRLSLHPKLHFNLHLNLHLNVPIYLSTYLSIYLPIYLPIYLSTHLSIYLSI